MIVESRKGHDVGVQIRIKLDTVFASPDITANAYIHNPLPAHFYHIERFQSYPDKRVDGVMTAFPLAYQGDPLFIDGISAESNGNIAFASTPEDLFVEPVVQGNLTEEQYTILRTEAYDCVASIKMRCPFIGVCNSVASRTGFTNSQMGDMAIYGIVKFIANFRTRVSAGLPLIITPYASSEFAQDKTGTVLGREERLVAQVIVAGSDDCFPGSQLLTTNFNLFAVSGFSVNSFMDGYTVGAAYILK